MPMNDTQRQLHQLLASMSPEEVANRVVTALNHPLLAASIAECTAKSVEMHAAFERLATLIKRRRNEGEQQ